MSTNRCMEKRCGIYIYSHTHIYNGILVIKKNEIMQLAATWMDLEIIILNEVSQRKIPHDITYMWNLKYNTMNLSTEQK